MKGDEMEASKDAYRDRLKTAQAAVADALEVAPPGCRGELAHAAAVLKVAGETAERSERRMVRRFPPRGDS